MKGDRNNKNSVIDFTELDANLEVLVLSIGEFFSKKNGNITEDYKAKPNKEKPKIKKKLNVELIKRMILETQAMQEKNKKTTNNEKK